MPERFHLRGIPVCPTEEEGELEEEAQWVFKYAFNQPTVSRQEGEQAERPGGIASGVQQRDPGTADKIRDALNFMRNQQFEVRNELSFNPCAARPLCIWFQESSKQNKMPLMLVK